MSKKVIVTVIASILLLSGVVWAIASRQSAETASSSTTTAGGSQSTADTQTPSPESPTKEVSDCESTDSAEITYADGTFSPSCIKIKSGTTVTWKNTSNKKVEVGTDPHPSHTGNREVSGGAFVLDLAAGETATTTLTTKGEHSFHDHLSPSDTGVIIVE
jgi:plastocyanin